MGPRLSCRGNGKSHSLVRWTKLSASMGPRLSCRGNFGKSFPAACRTGSTLQWGHDFLAVEIECRKSAYGLTSMSLQWGHDFLAVEINTGYAGEREVILSFNGATTFLPWKCYCRCVDRRAKAGFNGATTFLPWKSGPAALYGVYSELQWGHDFLAVEMRGSVSGEVMQPGPLQWGHDFLAVEIRCQTSWEMGRSLQLQWGHDFLAVEISERRPAMPGDRIASMGPRLSCRGNCQCGCLGHSCQDSFNGATTFLPWKWRPFFGLR